MQSRHKVALLIVLQPVTSIAPTVAVSLFTDEAIDATCTVSHDLTGPTVEVTLTIALPDRVTPFTTALVLLRVTSTHGFTATGKGETATNKFRVPESAAWSVGVSGAYTAATVRQVIRPVAVAAAVFLAAVVRGSEAVRPLNKRPRVGRPV